MPAPPKDKITFLTSYSPCCHKIIVGSIVTNWYRRTFVGLFSIPSSPIHMLPPSANLDVLAKNSYTSQFRWKRIHVCTVLQNFNQVEMADSNVFPMIKLLKTFDGVKVSETNFLPYFHNPFSMLWYFLPYHQGTISSAFASRLMPVNRK